ncbi:MAG: hypothetical protein ACLFQV_03805, partial [Vulcanimicrobiota bacterium]
VTLESMKPLTFVGSQAMIFFDPIVRVFAGFNGYAKLQKILEDREKVEQLISAIEKFEDEKK